MDSSGHLGNSKNSKYEARPPPPPELASLQAFRYLCKN